MFRSWLPRLVSVLALVALPSAAHAQFTIQRTSTPVFYNDIGENPSLQCAYATYEITNTGPSAVADVWVDIANFTGGVVDLAPGEDGVSRLGPMTAGQTKLVGFYLRAASTTATAQGHTVRVFTAPPPGTPAASQAFSFSEVRGTIGASANKVTTVVSGPTPPGLGGIVTITVTGETGTIGADRVLAFTPAAGLSWQAGSFELVGVTITLSGSANAGVVTDSLIHITPAAAATDYVVEYRFRAVNTTMAPVLITPIGYIASGTQIKHTDTGNYGSFPPIQPPSNFVTVSKLASPSRLVDGGHATWTVRFTNGAAYTVFIDDIVDRLPAGAVYLPGSSTFGGSPIADPAQAGMVLTWGSFFTLPASGARDLVYRTYLPPVYGTYVNSALGHVGNVVVDSTSATTDSLPAHASIPVTRPDSDVSLVKSASPDPVTIGTPLVYHLVVTNAGPDTATAVSVLDTLDASVTFVSATTTAGTVSELANVVTALLGRVPPGRSDTVTVTVTPNALGPLGNVARASTNAADPDSADRTSGVTVTVVPVLVPGPDLSTSKTSDGPFTVGTNGTYTITVRNVGTAPTTAAIAVLDSLPAGTTYVSGAGAGWVVGEGGGVVNASYAAALAAGDSATFTITVAVGPAAVPSVTNSALASTAGDASPGNDRGTDTTMVDPAPPADPDLSTTKTSDGPFTVGTNGTYTITVRNLGAGPTTAAIAVLDSLPAGTTYVSGAGAGWVVGEGGGVVNASYAAALAPGDSATFAITVAVGPAAVPSVTNSALASTAGDASPVNDRGTDTSSVFPPGGEPDLASTKSSDGPFTVGANGTYFVRVDNVGTAPTTGAITVRDTLAAGLSFVGGAGAGWAVSEASGVVTGTRAAALAVGDSAGFSITVAVGPGATPFVLNRAWASTPGDTRPDNDAGFDSTAVNPAPPTDPDLATTKTSNGPFTVGTNGTYTITVRNVGAGPTTAAIAVLDSLPAGTTYVSGAGAGWVVGEGGGVVNASYAAALAAGDSAEFTITVAVGPAAVPSVTNSALASTAGDASPANDRGTDTTTVDPPPATPDLAVTKSAVAPFVVGQPASYRISVRNVGAGATTGAISLSDVLPAGLTYVAAAGTGWSVAPSPPTVNATYAALLAAGDSAILVVDVTVGPAAYPSVTNTATASTAGDATPGNDSGTSVTAVGGAPDVALTKVATAPFAVGFPGTYRLVARNVGIAPTTSAIAVVDTLPAGLTFVSAIGGGWVIGASGNIVTATRAAALAPGDSAVFTITTDVAPAALPMVTNTAVASTPGDIASANDRAVAPTTVGGTPDLALAKRATGAFTVGALGRYALTVSNLGSAATSSPIVVRDTLAAGLAFAGGNGTGWSFGVAGDVVTATYPAALAAGDSATFTLEVTVGLAAYPSVANAAVVTSAGDPADGDDRGSSGPVAVGIDGQLALDKTVATPDAEVASAIIYTLVVRNIGVSSVPGVTVVDSLPVGFRYVRGSARLDGAPLADPAGVPGRTLTFAVGTVPANAARTLSYRTFVDAAALLGDGVNRAVARNDALDVRSNTASVAVRVHGGAFAPEGVIAGKIWLDCDCDGDRVQGDAEPGIPGVRVWLEDGRSAITDVEGKYVFSPVSPRLHVVKVDRTTLPAGARLVALDTRNAGDGGSRFVDLRNGELARADFAERTCAPEVVAEVRARRELGEVRAGLAAGQPTAPSDVFPGATRVLAGAPFDAPSAERVEDGVFHHVEPAGSLHAANSRRTDAPGQPGLFAGHPPGPVTLGLSVPRRPVPADGRTLVPVTVTSNEGVTRVTLEADAGLWRVADMDPKIDGVQTEVHGTTTFLLVAPERADVAGVRVTRRTDFRGDPVARGANALRDADRVETTIAFVPATRPWVVAGVLQGRVDRRSLEDAELAPGQERDGFDAPLSVLSTGDEDGSLSAGARGALFVRGGIDPRTRLTLRYDSERAGDRRRFDDIRPDEGYPIFGDASIPGFEAQGSDRLFARIDRDRSHVLFGDFVTPASGPTRVLGTYTRSLNGAAAHLEDERFALDGFASHERDRQVVDEIPGRGISGPYPLSRADGVFNSERIEVVTRDRNNPSLILDRRPLTRFADYTIEPYSGRLLFRQPVPSVDERLNPVSIRVVYEVEGGGDRFWTAGGSGSFKPVDRLELGGTYVREDDPLAERTFAGAGGTLALARGTFLTGEWASSDTDSGASGPAGAGDAWRAELRHRSDRLDARGFMVRTDAGFANPSSGFAPDREEAGGAGRFAIDPKTALTAEGVRSRDRSTDGRRKGATLGLERRLGGGFLAEVGYRWARETLVPAGGGPFAATPNEVDAVRGRLVAQFDRRRSASLEYEQETGSTDRQRLALGGDARVTDHLRLYGRHELLSSLAGPYALSPGQYQHTTAFGLAADGMDDLTAFSEYRARDAFDGRRAEAAVGLRNRWALSPAFRVDFAVERVSPLGRAPGDGAASAFAGGVSWIGDPRSKGHARFEYRTAEDDVQALASLALARKLSRDWTGLVRSTWTWRPGGGDFVAGRSQLALALRETDRNQWNALMRLEHRLDGSGVPAFGGSENEAFVASAHANLHPSRRLTVTGQAAGKWSESRSADGAARNQATLVGGRGMYELTPKFDVALAARRMISDSFERRNEALGAEIGWTPARNLRLAGGYNAFGFKNPDIPGLNRTDRGPYLDVGLKFDELLFGGSADEARGAAQATALPASEAGLPAAPVPPADPATTLTPGSERISDQAIAADRRTIEGWDARFAALPDTIPPYPRAKGRAWLGFARGALSADDRSGAADSALAYAIALYQAIGDTTQAADSAAVAAAIAASWPAGAAGRAAVPADLAEQAAALAGHPGAHCAAEERARLEVALAALARQAEAAPGQVPCRIAPSLDEARGLAARALALAEECIKPVEIEAPVDTTLPPPVEPNAEIEEALSEIPAGIHFAVNRHTLASSSVDVCRRIAAVLARYPEVRVELVGHTDSRGSAAYNLALSQRRVNAVQGALVAAGVEAGRISTSFAGKDDLLTAERDARELALNRRVDFQYFDGRGNPIRARKQTGDIQVETSRP